MSSITRRCTFYFTLGCCMALYLFVAWPHVYLLVAGNAIRRRKGAVAREAFYAWERYWSKVIFGLFRRCMRITVTYTLPDVRDPRPGAIVIANHRSALDLFMLPAVMASAGYPRARGIVKRQIVHMPVVGRVAREIGCAFVRRGGDPNDIARVQRCAAGADEDGACVAIFPEGTLYGDPSFETRSRSRFRHLLPPRPGGVRTLVDALPHYPVLSVTFDWHGIDTATSVLSLHVMYRGRIDISAEYLDTPPGMSVETWLDREWRRKDSILSRKDA